ncbi:MAG TPA: YfcE family phosphodiesterase [Armatimonadetes bacterium]|nr:YfcE family phosphodiesterase [Armatimonadota bacterium]
MIIGILSDSHDHLTALRDAAAQMRAAGVEHVLWPGDFVAPFALPPIAELGVPVTAVLGNNDGERIGLAARFASLGWNLAPKFNFPVLDGVRCALHHEQEPVEALAASGLYDLVVYGHTHDLDVRQVGDSWIINPGETCGWLTGRATMVLFDTTTRQPEVRELARG